jgi:hypothetical protein
MLCAAPTSGFLRGADASAFGGVADELTEAEHVADVP